MSRAALLLCIALLSGCDNVLPPEILPTEPEDVRVLRGRVLLVDGAGDLRPLTGIRLAAFYSDSRWDVVSDDEGRFTLDGIPFVGINLEKCEPAYAFATKDLYFILPVEAAARNVDVVLRSVPLIERLRERDNTSIFLAAPPPPGADFDIEGRVLDRNGEPLADAEVFAEGTGRSARTDDAGGFRLTGLRKVGHDLRVRHGEKAFPITTGIDGGSIDAVIRELAGETISGIVRDASGRPLTDVTVDAVLDRGEEFLRRTGEPHADRTDRQGRFRIGGLGSGNYAVAVHGGGHAYYRGKRVRGVPAGSKEVVLTARVTYFETWMRFQGRVVDRQGRPVEGVLVTARPEGFRGPVVSGTTGESGSFGIYGVTAGNHTIAADRPGPRAELRRVMTGDCDLVLTVD